MPLKSSVKAVGIMFAMAFAPAHAGLLGSTVTGTLYYPDLSSVYGGPVTTSVISGTEFPLNSLNQPSGTLDVTDTQIIWNADMTVKYEPGSFNGFDLLFTGTSAITGVTLNNASTLTPVSFGFTSNQVWINLAELQATAGQKTILDVSVAAVPEPESYAMLLAGLGLLGFMARWKKQQPA
jgi:hypothetical protein